MRSLIPLFVFFCLPLLAWAQEADTTKVVDKPQRPAFESSFIIDNPTDRLFPKNTLEVVMNHRFGLINGGTNDLAGIWAPAKAASRSNR